MKLFLFISAILLSTPTWAHIPKLNTILTKVAANNGGTNALIIKRTVTLKDENVTSEETWYVANADLMKVNVTGSNSDGSKWAFEILYKDGKRFTSTVDGGLKAYPTSSEFYEPLLHYRSNKALQSKLVSLQIIPTWAGTNSQENFISLDRLKGGLVYLLGASETKNTQAPPQLWIEQDSFVLRKLRSGSQVDVDFDNIKDYSEGKIKQPDLQTVFWKNTTVTIQNTSLQVVPQAKVANQFKMEKGDAAKLPENVNLKEFYSRLR